MRNKILLAAAAVLVVAVASAAIASAALTALSPPKGPGKAWPAVNWRPTGTATVRDFDTVSVCVMSRSAATLTSMKHSSGARFACASRCSNSSAERISDRNWRSRRCTLAL